MKKIGVQMQPLNEAIPGYDNSLLILQEGQRRGYEVYHFLPQDVTLDETGKLTARARRADVDLSRPEGDQIRAGQDEILDLENLDVLFFRQDPPFDMAYITNTYLLERLEGEVLLVNHPRWIRDMPDKLSIYDFIDFMPPSIVTRDMDQIERFFNQHNQKLVLKPLYGFKGHGIELVTDLDTIKNSLDQTIEPIMFQPFLPEVKEGNKRIVLFDGQIIGALKSVPSDDFRVYRDSKDIAYTPSQAELDLCARLAPILQERGLIFVGIDLIGSYLTEINAGSVGSLVRLNEIYEDCFEAKLYDCVEGKVSN